MTKDDASILATKFRKGAITGLTLWVMFLLVEVWQFYFSSDELSLTELLFFLPIYVVVFSAGYMIPELGRYLDRRKLDKDNQK